MSRAPFFTAIITPALLATALAIKDAEEISWVRFALVMLGLVAAHAGANLVNDYYDFRQGADNPDVKRTPFSGGSPHLVEGSEKESTFLILAIASFAVCAACGVAVMVQLGRSFLPVLVIGIAGVLIGFFYTAPPLKLAYRGWGEVAIFLAFGVLPVLGVYYVLTESLTLDAFLVSLPLAFLITNIILVNEFPDFETDGRAGKRNLVVRMGTGKARFLYLAFVLAAFLSLAIFSLLPGRGRWGLLGMAGAPLALFAAQRVIGEHHRPEKLVPAQALTIVAHLITGLGFAAGVWISA